MYGSNAHVWWTQEVKEDEGGGVPLHSEFIARKKVVGITTFGLPFPFAL